MSNGQNAKDLYKVLLNQSYPKSMINAGYNEAMDNLNKTKQAQMESFAPKKMEIVTFSIVQDKPSFFDKVKNKFRKN